MSILKSENKSSSKIQPRRVSLIIACFIFSVVASPAQTDNRTIRDLAVTPEKLSASFSGVAKRVEPAVVNIDTKGRVPEVVIKGENSASETDDILNFLRRQTPSRPPLGVGSGFIVDKSGYILTNYHVVEDATRISVKLQSGEEFVARVVGFDEETDVAVLRISAGRELPFVKLGDSDKAEVGDWVLAIGSPFGLAQTVTAGIVSQTRRETPQASVFQKFIQTDASINRGNSGGPLVNMNAEVIGINSQIATTTGESNGIGFALPSNEAANVFRQIVSGGRVRRGYLGVLLDSVKPEFAKVYNLPEARGAIITELRDKQSAAGKAGLQTGDIITQFNDEPVRNAADLIQKVASATPEREVSVTYFREVGLQLERRTTVIKLGERPSSNVMGETGAPRKLPVGGQKTAVEPFGLTLSELTPQLAANYRTESRKGVVVKTINPASFIADVKTANGLDALNEGDLIQRVNRVSVTDLKTFNEIALKLKTGDAVVMHVVSPITRGAQMRILQFTVQ